MLASCKDQIFAPSLKRPTAQRYSMALAAVLAATGWASVLSLFGLDGPHYFPFLVAGITAAWYGGLEPALLAIALGGILSHCRLVPPRQFVTVHGTEGWIAIAAYFFVAMFAAILFEAHRRELRELSDEIATREQIEEGLHFTISHLRSAKDAAQVSERQALAERKDLRARLHASEERMAMAEKAAGFRLFVWEVVENRLEILGEPAGVFGTATWVGYGSLLACLHPEDRARTETELTTCMAQKLSIDMEFRIIWPDGSLHWVAAKGHASHDDAGAPLRMIGIFQEITKRKATEEALIRTEKLAAAGRLAAAIAHEINNPLCAVTNLLFITKDDPTLSEAGRQYLGMAQQELARAAQVAQQALGFYKENSEPLKVNVATLVDDVLQTHARNMPKNIKVETHYPQPCEVVAVRGEIQQVVSNVVTNAVQAMSSGGQIEIEVTAVRQGEQPGAQIKIKDNGPGIPPENLGRVFEPFFTTKGKAGTGLGLWLVEQIVHKHGGKIDIQSTTEAAHHGTCFSIFLPVGTRSGSHAAA
jgi:signal transduction histidine kinase